MYYNWRKSDPLCLRFFLALLLIKNGRILPAKIEVLAVFYNETLGGVELFLMHNKVGRSGNMLAGKNPNMNVSSAEG